MQVAVISLAALLLPLLASAAPAADHFQPHDHHYPHHDPHFHHDPHHDPHFNPHHQPSSGIYYPIVHHEDPYYYDEGIHGQQFPNSRVAPFKGFTKYDQHKYYEMYEHRGGLFGKLG